MIYYYQSALREQCDSYRNVEQLRTNVAAPWAANMIAARAIAPRWSPGSAGLIWVVCFHGDNVAFWHRTANATGGLLHVRGSR